MNFVEQLNYYINELNCSLKDLALSSGISTAAISRYRTGERTPSLKNSQLEKLSNGIAKIAISKGCNKFSKETVLSAFNKSLNCSPINSEQFKRKFNELISTLSINISELSRALVFDSSYISKIRTGKRTPANINNFIDSLCNFVANKYNSVDRKKAVALLINCSVDDLSSSSSYFSKLELWFISNYVKSDTSINDFLKKLDEFNLNEYIKVIHFDEMKVPSVPFYKHSSKNYYGIEQMKQGELDFFKSTVLSKSNEDVFMCSDMPMEDMAKDIDFGKKWMYAIAMTLKKGLHLNIIHSIDRPFNEMLLGLESWIPIYMTGQVSPFYLKGTPNSVYCHFNYVSGKVALTGECITGFHRNCKYYLTSNLEEVNYYKTKAKDLLSKARSPYGNL